MAKNHGNFFPPWTTGDFKAAFADAHGRTSTHLQRVRQGLFAERRFDSSHVNSLGPETTRLLYLSEGEDARTW